MSRRSYINHASNHNARNPFKSLLRLIRKISRKTLDICSKILYNALHGRISVFRKTHRSTTLHNRVLQETLSYATLLREAYRLRSVVTQVLRKQLKVSGFQTAFKFLVRTTRKGDGKMNKFSFVRKLGLAASLLIALVLAGCAGGGSDDPAPPPPVIPVAKLMLEVTPANGATSVPKDGNIVAVVKYENAGTFVPAIDMLCNGTSVKSGNRAEVMEPLAGRVTYTQAYKGAYSALCTVTVDIAASGTGGASAPAHAVAQNSVTLETAPWWPPANITPMGVKVYGTEFSQLPAGCTSVYATPFDQSSGFSACWKDFVKTNKMKWVQTSRTMLGTTPAVQATRPIIFAAFITPKGRFQVMTMYADTGDSINQFEDIDSMITPEGIEFMIGNDQGYIFHEKISTACWQLRWNPPTTTPNVSSNVWDFESVTCPL